MKDSVKNLINRWYGTGCPPWTWPATLTPAMVGLLHIDGFTSAYMFVAGFFSGLLTAIMVHLHDS